MTKKRLDVLLVERGLAESTRAGAGARDGGARARVLEGRRAGRRGRAARGRGAAAVRLARRAQARERARRVRGRSGSGLDCLDIGASTGGFTDVLLQRGARRVIALDVGHGQLHPRLRDDPRVTVLERTNARALTELPFAPQLVTCDVSFISCRTALPPALRARGARLAGARAREAAVRGRAGRRAEGRRPGLRRCGGACCARSPRRRAAGRREWPGLVDSGLPGPKGNHEFVLHLVHAEQPQSSQASSTAGSPMPSVERAAVVTHGRTRDVGPAVRAAARRGSGRGRRAAVRAGRGRALRRRRRPPAAPTSRSSSAATARCCAR